MTDVAEWMTPAVLWALSEAHPAAYRELVLCRWLANLFSPRWGWINQEQSQCKPRQNPKPN
jgi:hypothetical protein